MDVRFSESARITSAIEGSYHALLGVLGTSSMEQEFFRSIHAVVDEVDRIYCFEQRGDSQPELYCASAPMADSTGLIQQYRVQFHRVDPIQGVLPSIPDAGCAAITFHADEIQNTAYRRACFERFSIRHRLSVVKHVGDRWLTLSVARRTRAFVAEEIESLSTLGRLALPLVARNAGLLVRTPGGNFSVPEMERRLACLAKGFTQRERQVCARTLVGMSAEGTALDLGISHASVLTYRQRAYRRAQVSNAIQLAALVMH